MIIVIQMMSQVMQVGVKVMVMEDTCQVRAVQHCFCGSRTSLELNCYTLLLHSLNPRTGLLIFSNTYCALGLERLRGHCTATLDWNSAQFFTLLNSNTFSSAAVASVLEMLLPPRHFVVKWLLWMRKHKRHPYV